MIFLQYHLYHDNPGILIWDISLRHLNILWILWLHFLRELKWNFRFYSNHWVNVQEPEGGRHQCRAPYRWLLRLHVSWRGSVSCQRWVCHWSEWGRSKAGNMWNWVWKREAQAQKGGRDGSRGCSWILFPVLGPKALDGTTQFCVNDWADIDLSSPIWQDGAQYSMREIMFPYLKETSCCLSALTG